VTADRERASDNRRTSARAASREPPHSSFYAEREWLHQIGIVMYCSLTAQGSATAYPVKVQVDSISGTKVHFSIVVSQTPGHFTPPS